MKTALFALLGSCLLAFASAGCYHPCPSNGFATYPRAKEPPTFYQMPKSVRDALPPPPPAVTESYPVYYPAPYYGPYVYRPYIGIPRSGGYVYQQNYVHFGYGHSGQHFGGFHGGHGGTHFGGHGHSGGHGHGH